LRWIAETHGSSFQDLGLHFTLDVCNVSRLALAATAPFDIIVVLAVVEEGIWKLAVNFGVTDHELLVAVTEWDAHDVFDEEANSGCPEQIPADDEEEADDLQPDLSAVAVDGSTGVNSAEGLAALIGSEDASQKATNYAPNQMGMEVADHIVSQLQKPLLLSQDVHRNPRDRARAKTNNDCTPASDETSSRCNSNKTGDDALDCANDGRLLEKDQVHDGPCKHAHSRADIGVEYRSTGIGAGRVWITTIEAVPAKPENTDTDQAEEDVVWMEVVAIDWMTRAYPIGHDETGHARGHVNDISAGIVENTHGGKEPTSPKGESADGVREREPQWHECHPCEEVHTRETGASNKDQSDCSEDELEIDHGRLRERLGDMGGWQSRLLQFVVNGHSWTGSADERQHLLPETGFEGIDDPADQNGCKGVHYHERRVDRPLLLHHPSVQNRQSRQALQADQGCRCNLPRIVTVIEPTRVRIPVGVLEGHFGGVVGFRFQQC